MKDSRGLFYYPFPTNHRLRCYVHDTGGEIHFRLYNDDDPELWKAHGWVPHSAIVQAAAIYQGRPFDPRRAYDLPLARQLLAEAQSDGQRPS